MNNQEGVLKFELFFILHAPMRKSQGGKSGSINSGECYGDSSSQIGNKIVNDKTQKADND